MYCGVYLYDLKLIALNALNPKHCLFCALMFFSCLYVLIFVGICFDVCINMFTAYDNG